MNNSEKIAGMMLPAMLILFILQVILLPVMIGLTYADQNVTVAGDGSTIVNVYYARKECSLKTAPRCIR